MYQVGDTVKIIKPPNGGSHGWNQQMDELVGMECTIKSVHPPDYNSKDTYYYVKENRWVYGDDYFESALPDIEVSALESILEVM